MADNYFRQLPNMFYNNILCKDITRRVALIETEGTSPYVFYPYEIKHQLRSDLIAEYYYSDSQLDWFIYMTNQIVDPYYQWYLTDNQFASFINEKYGSVEKAIKKIKYYKTNWESDEKEISVSYYENNIDETWKKYYTPNFGVANKITSYKRRQEDVTINTNRILEYSVHSNNNDLSFIPGEIIDIRTTGTNTVATGECVYSNLSHVAIQHVSGNTFVSGSSMKYLIGETSSANITSNGFSIIVQNITEEEEVFWSPVTQYDYDFAMNEQRKNINLIGNGLSDLAIREFVDRMREDVDPTSNMVID